VLVLLLLLLLHPLGLLPPLPTQLPLPLSPPPAAGSGTGPEGFGGRGEMCNWWWLVPRGGLYVGTHGTARTAGAVSTPV